MNKKLIFSYLYAILLLLNACKSQFSTTTGDDGIINFQLVQLNDVYEIAPLEGGKSGGMARVASLVDSLRHDNPNTLLFMAGDFLNPSLIGTMKYNGERIRGKQMIEVMNAMKFDLVAFGNHEFDLKYKDLQKRLNESNFNWILGNALHHKNKKNEAFYKEIEGNKQYIPKTKIFHLKDTDGTRINLGFFSEIVNSNPKDYVKYINPFEQARKDIAQLKQSGSDLIIGLTHLNKEDDLQLLEQQPQVPLIMGGHEHYNMLLTASTGGKVAKADANAKTIYLHKIRYNKQTREVRIVSILIPVNEKVKSKPQIKKLVDKWQQILMNKVQHVADNPESVLWHTDEALDAREKSIRHRQTNFGKLLTDAMLSASRNNAVIAIVNSGSIRIDDQLSGDITAMDFFRALPFGGSIYDVQIKGSLLKKVMNYSEQHKGKGSYLQHSQNLKRNTQGIWTVENKPIDDKRVYNIMVSDYLMKGYDIPILNENNPEVIKIDKPRDKNDIRNDIRKTIIHYLKNT